MKQSSNDAFFNAMEPDFGFENNFTQADKPALAPIAGSSYPEVRSFLNRLQTKKIRREKA